MKTEVVSDFDDSRHADGGGSGGKGEVAEEVLMKWFIEFLDFRKC